MKRAYKMNFIFTFCIICLLMTNDILSQNVKVTKVSDDVIILHPSDVLDLSIVREVGGTVTAVRTDSGVVVIDSFGSLESAKQARRLIHDRFPNTQLKHLICSHHHPDHIRGIQYFGDACVIGHERLEKYIVQDHQRLKEKYGRYQEKIDSLEHILKTGNHSSPNGIIEDDLAFWKGARNFLETFTPTLPNILINSNTLLKLGGKTFEILYFGTAHTDNDLVVLVREDRVLIMSDLFCHKKCNLMNPESDAENWISLLTRLIDRKNEYDLIIPGHGGTIETIDALIDQRNYLIDICKYVETAKKSMSLEEAKENISFTKYENYMMYDKMDLDIEAYWKQLERRKPYNEIGN